MVAPTNRSGPYLDGDSIGWEGDTLVVHTIGFNGKTWVDHAGHPHSDQLHVNRADPNNLLIDVKIEESQGAHAAVGRTTSLSTPAQWNITEMVCEDNVNFDEFLKNEATSKK